jgi:hypothetical protein
MEVTAQRLSDWFGGLIPRGWYVGPIQVRADREEILVVGLLPAPELAEDLPSDARAAALRAVIDRHRALTREQRTLIAAEAERRFGRKVSWGASCGELCVHFTTLSVPVMTRLRLPERQVLDTLIDAGVARSRSDALAWCVRLVATHEGDWLAELREAFARVARVRASGPPLV